MNSSMIKSIRSNTSINPVLPKQIEPKITTTTKIIPSLYYPNTCTLGNVLSILDDQYYLSCRSVLLILRDREHPHNGTKHQHFLTAGNNTIPFQQYKYINNNINNFKLNLTMDSTIIITIYLFMNYTILLIHLNTLNHNQICHITNHIHHLIHHNHHRIHSYHIHHFHYNNQHRHYHLHCNLPHANHSYPHIHLYVMKMLLVIVKYRND